MNEKNIDIDEKLAYDIEGVNEIYKHVLRSDARIIICYGGRDSGKSYFVGGQYIPYLLCSDEYFRGVAVRKVHATHRDSCYLEVLDGIDTMAEQDEIEKERIIKDAKSKALAKIKRDKEKEKQKLDNVKKNVKGKRKNASKKKGIFSKGKNPEPDVITEKSIIAKAIQKANTDMPTDGIKHRLAPLSIEHTNGNKLIFRGLDNPRKLKSLKGISHVWVEEAEDLSLQEFYELLLLLRGGDKQQIVLTFNPVDEYHFSNGMFVESVADEVLEKFDNGEKKVWIKNIIAVVEGKEHITKVLVLQTTYEDNAYISIDRKAAIEQLANTDPFLYDVYRLGKFGTKGGRILLNVVEEDFAKKSWKFGEFDNKGYAQDFGFNHANCILAVGEKDNELYVFDEIYGYGKDTGEWIVEANKKELDKHLSVVCDCAEPDRIKTWQKAGYKAVGVKKYSGSVNGQIDRLKRYNNIYIDVSCENTLREAREWKWKQKKNGRYIDEPANVYDDAMAALRYSADLFVEGQAAMRNVSTRRKGRIR